jgi:hypothetical protein
MKDLHRHLAALDQNLVQLDRVLEAMPTKTTKLYLALCHAVERGGDAIAAADLAPDSRQRLRHEIAERIALVLARHGV